MPPSNESHLFYAAVGKNIRKFREAKNYSLQILAEKIGLTKKTVQRYENGEIKIDMGRLADIASALTVDMGQILNGTYNFLGLNTDNETLVRLPIVGQVSCGNGFLSYDEIEGYELTPSSWINGGEYIYSRASGDSMINARIYDNDLVLIRRQPDVEDGEIAAVLIDGNVFLKRVFKRDGKLILQSENPNYAPIVCNPKNNECYIIGKLKKVVISV